MSMKVDIYTLFNQDRLFVKLGSVNVFVTSNAHNP